MKFFEKHKGKLILVGIAIFIVGLISLTSAGIFKNTIIERAVLRVTTPIQGAVTGVGNAITNRFSGLKNIMQSKNENDKLKIENKKLKDQILKYELVIGKEEFLKNEYELTKSSKYNFQNGKVIAKEPGNWFQKFTIDRGLRDGIKDNDIVILGFEEENGVTIEGLVGKIVEANETSSKVVSIIDISNSVSFNTVSGGEGGISKGSVDGVLEGTMFDIKTNVVKGDKVTTSGIGGVYDEGIYIGEVTEVKKSSNDLLTHIKIQPGINFSKIQEVFVISNIKGE